MNTIQVYALQALLFDVAALGTAVLIASLILPPITRAIDAAGARFWDAVDRRRAARRS